jgi:hypothetical protein
MQPVSDSNRASLSRETPARLSGLFDAQASKESQFHDPPLSVELGERLQRASSSNHFPPLSTETTAASSSDNCTYPRLEASRPREVNQDAPYQPPETASMR